MSWVGGWLGGGGSSPASTPSTSGSQWEQIARYGSVDVVKTPTESVRVEFPWAVRLDGETVASDSYELPDGLTDDGHVGTGSLRSVLVSGGSDGSLYRVIATAITSGGRTLQWVKRVMVIEG